MSSAKFRESARAVDGQSREERRALRERDEQCGARVSNLRDERVCFLPLSSRCSFSFAHSCDVGSTFASLQPLQKLATLFFLPLYCYGRKRTKYAKTRRERTIYFLTYCVASLSCAHSHLRPPVLPDMEGRRATPRSPTRESTYDFYGFLSRSQAIATRITHYLTSLSYTVSHVSHLFDCFAPLKPHAKR